MIEPITTININDPLGYPYGEFPITDSCERSAKIMGEDYVRLVFNSTERVTFKAFSWIVYDDHTFFLPEQYIPTPNGTKDIVGGVEAMYYSYDVKFVSVANMLSKHVCYRHVRVDSQEWYEPEININGTLETMYVIVMGAISRAANEFKEIYYGYLLSTIYDNGIKVVNGVSLPNTDNVRLTAGTKLLTFNFSGESIADVCTTIANNYTKDDKKDTEWYITEDPISSRLTLHFAKCETDDSEYVFTDYVGGELKKVEYAQEWSGIAQMIIPYGSTRNMTWNAVKGIDEYTQMQSTFGKRLRLRPNTTYRWWGLDNERKEITTNDYGGIENDFADTGIEVVKFYEEIYPQCHFKVSNVEVKNKRQDGEIVPEYTIEAVPIDEDKNVIDKSLLTDNGFYPIKIEEATTLSVRFESGLLNGREFEIANKTRLDAGETTYSLKFTIVADGSIEDGTLIPSGNFIPRLDDELALFNMKMPNEYIEYAEEALAKRAYEELLELQNKRPEVKCSANPTTFNAKLALGRKVKVYSELFNSEHTFLSRVIDFSYKLTKPYDMQFSLASAIMQGTLSSMNDAIADVTQQAGGLSQRAVNLSRRGWRDASEMADMIDSLAADMMLVGNEKYQFSFTSEIECIGYGIEVSHGTMQHTQEPYISYANGGWWEVSAQTITTDKDNVPLDPNVPYYLYAVVKEESRLAELMLSADEMGDEQYLLLGILSSEFEQERVFNRTNGFTAIAGGTITTEQIQDAGRNLIIDFQSDPPKIIARGKAEIIGQVKFLMPDGTTKDISDYDYLTQALKKGSTDINGGLLMTQLLQLKDMQERPQAGMSGLQDNILLWGGGSYNDAVAALEGDANTINTLFRKDGTGKMGVFEVNRDNTRIATSQGAIVIDDNEGMSCLRPNESEPVVKVTPNELPNLEMMRGEDISYSDTLTLPEQNASGRGVDDFSITSQVSRWRISVGGGTTLNVSGGITHEEVSSSGRVRMMTEQEADEEGTPSATCMVFNIVKDGVSIGTYTCNSAARDSVTILLEDAGEYIIEYYARVRCIVENAMDMEASMVVKVGGRLSYSVSYTRLHKQTTIAYKGMFTYQGDNAYFYYKDGVGLECKVNGVTLVLNQYGIKMKGLPQDDPQEDGALYISNGNIKISGY